MSKRRKKRKHAKFNTKMYFKILGLSLMIVLGMFFITMALGAFPDKTSNVDVEDEIVEDVIEPVDKATGKINALLLGVDAEGLRTDTIMIVSYDLDNSKINVLSIPRDTRMYIGSKYQKINSAHAISKNGEIKGAAGTIEAVTRLTGIPINYYVEFSFETFRNTIDALGGVYFDVPRNMFYEDPVQDLYINLKKGYQFLDGDKAEQLVRFRRYPEGDIARVEMQQKFLQALLEQKLNATIITKIPDLYKQLNEDITTNVKLGDILKYMPNLNDLKMENISMYQLPGGFNDTDYGASYWICNIAETKTLIENVFGYDSSKITIDSADGSSASKNKKTTSKKTTKSTATEKPKNADTATATPKSNTTKKTSTAEKQKTSSTVKPSATEKSKATSIVKPRTTEKPKSTSTAKPSTTEKSKSTTTVKPSVTEKQKNTSTEKPKATSTTKSINTENPISETTNKSKE